MAGLLPEPEGPPVLSRTDTDVAMLHRMQCDVCPLAKIATNRNPNMGATGSSKPLVYILGEAPGKHEDQMGEQFVGDSGKFLRPKIPRAYRDKVRFNNVVRTRPPKNRTPEWMEIECCRPSVIDDIERTKPKVILGFGNVPLEWAAKVSRVTVWRGRRMPVTIGNHTCWFYPMLHPSYLIRQRNDGRARHDALGVGSEDERMFVLDLKRVFAEIKKLPEPVVHTAADARANIEIITEGGLEGLKRVQEALRWAAKQKVVGVDYETTCIRPYEKGARILSAAVGTAERTIAFPFQHPDAEWDDGDLEALWELWWDFLCAPKVKRISHNLAFELEWTGVTFGVETVRAGEWEDTATQACILDERRGGGKPGALSLDFLVKQYFGFNLKTLSNVDRKRLAETPLDVVLMYNGLDAKYHELLWHAQDKRIKADKLQEAYVLGRRRVPTVVLTQMKGVPVDQKEVKRLQKKYGDLIEDILDQIAALPDVKKYVWKHGTYNPMSNPDALKLFHDMLGYKECLVEDKFTKKPKKSVSEEVLAKIDHPLARLTLELRKANKRKSTYIDPLREGSDVLYPDGLLHAQFNTIFTDTGRLSCDNPNLQNFPKRDEEAREVRRQVRAPAGERVLALDYGQIEARVVAMFTQDERFVQALWDRYDIHMDWAERIARAYPDRIGGRHMLTDKKIMKAFRGDIKNQWTFPLIYGASANSASNYLSIPLNVVEEMFEQFWDYFEPTKKWQESQIEFYQKNGYVSCLTGRRRRGPLSLNKILNSPVQGTAAEIVMDGMSRLSELDIAELQPEINIHDDLTYLRVPKNRVDELVEQIVTEMLDVPFEWVNVPITVEVSYGRDWDQLEDIGEFSSDEWFGD